MDLDLNPTWNSSRISWSFFSSVMGSGRECSTSCSAVSSPSCTWYAARRYMSSGIPLHLIRQYKARRSASDRRRLVRWRPHVRRTWVHTWVHTLFRTWTHTLMHYLTHAHTSGESTCLLCGSTYGLKPHVSYKISVFFHTFPPPPSPRTT